ncbi:DUF3577 domain-containing protein [Limnohabitans sp. DM1]|uniref:DUF3577 domain-containing protein n=1 Tax=Limnohabitans sp. DM1 TaxID=1597955 RepID=UPI000AC78047|nr:DUF3577 domain-containing protein [Limnohabitans sp. DM1]
MSEINTQSSANASNSAKQQGNNYVDMHTMGIGYLSRVREVTVRKGKPFVSCSISGFHGEKGVEDGMTFVPFDVKAASAQAHDVLKQFEAQANDRDCKVMIKFRIGDQYIDTYRVTKGDRAGQIGYVLKGRLLQITHVWIKATGQSSYALAYEKPAAQPETPAQAPQADGTNG